ncbi:hypothetical protein Tco_0133874 [Tanacetum coccineum]
MLYSAAYRILGVLQTEPTFQVVLDSLALTLCYSAFLTTADVPKVYMHQFWDSIHKSDLEFMVKTFMNFPLMKILCLSSKNLVILGKSSQSPKLLLIGYINLGEHLPLSSTEVYLERQLVLTSFVFLEHKSFGECTIRRMWTMLNYFGKISLTKSKTKRNKIGMHTSRDDYLIKTLRFVSTKEESQINEARLPKSMTISSNEPTRKSKRVKRPAKKSYNAHTTSFVIRDTPVMSSSKKKEKFEEVRKKNMKDFHKTHPSGSGIVTSAAKIKSSVTNEGTSAKPGVPCVTEEESTKSEAESWGKYEEDSNNDHYSRSEGSDQERDSGDDNTQSDSEKGSDSGHETDENESGSESDQEENEEEIGDDKEEEEDGFVKTPSNDTDDEDETKIKDKAEVDEDEGMDYTTNQFDDDVDLRMNEPVTTDEGFIQKEGNDAEIINVQQGNENPKISINQVIKDAHVTLSIVLKKTEVPVTSSSHSFDLASKFLQF